MISGYMKLSYLRDTAIHQREICGEIVDCISIPIKRNCIRMSNDGTLLLGLMIRQRSAKEGGSPYYMSVSYNKSMSDEIEFSGYKTRFKYIGTFYVNDTRNK